MLSPDREDGEISWRNARWSRSSSGDIRKFKSVVADGRKNASAANKDVRPLIKNWADYADGRILSGKEALEIGLVDQLGSFEDAVNRAEKIAKTSGSATLINAGSGWISATSSGSGARAKRVW